MKDKLQNRWIALLVLGVLDALLIAHLPDVLMHHSSEDRHRFLFLNKSPIYWLSMLLYVSLCLVGVALSVLLLMNRSTTRLTTPITTFLTKRRAFTWSAIILVAVNTLLVLSIPEIAARALFIHRYGAHRT